MLYAVVCVLLVCTHLCTAVLVNTTLGALQGRVITLVDDYHPGVEVNTFYGIPFAKPPLGDLRFAPPEFPEPWEGVFDATHHADWCMQYYDADLKAAHPERDINEDCLNVNIFAPADQSGAPYPVMVWIYGGGYGAGSNLGYLGHFHAAQGVVMVIPNYRLGIFGFAYSGDDAIPGNIGLMDQIHALQYVQDNIAAFGGDPGKVTIAGQSAGGTSVGQLILSPLAAGLFHQAIPQSGCDLSNWGTNGPDHDAEQYTLNAAAELGCPTDDSAAMVECMRSRPAAMLNNLWVDCKEGYFCMGFVPVVDGPGGVIPDRPLAMRQRGEFNKVPEMIGLTRHDGFTFISSLGPEIWPGPGPTYEEMRTVIRRTVDYFVPRGIPEDRADDLEEAIMWYITDWPHLHDEGNNRHQIGEAGTDASYGYVADQQARSHSQYAPVYFYVFEYVSENSLWWEWMGSDHSSEIPYVMGYPLIRHNPDVLDQTGLEEFPDYPWTEEDDEWAYFIIKLWTNFAKYGNPTPEPVSPPGDHDPLTWSNYTTDDYNYAYLSRDIMGTYQAYRQHQYAFWREYVPYLVLRDELPSE